LHALQEARNKAMICALIEREIYGPAQCDDRPVSEGKTSAKAALPHVKHP